MTLWIQLRIISQSLLLPGLPSNPLNIFGLDPVVLAQWSTALSIALWKAIAAFASSTDVSGRCSPGTLIRHTRPVKLSPVIVFALLTAEAHFLTTEAFEWMPLTCMRVAEDASFQIALRNRMS